MKKMLLALLLLAACSDDTSSSVQNNGDHDAGLDAVSMADVNVEPDLPTTIDVGADVVEDTTTAHDSGVAVDLSPLGGDRPVTPRLPKSYDENKKHPLLIILHGFGASGSLQRLFFRTDVVQDDLNLIVLAPNGTSNSAGQGFWNASDFCCDFEATGVDDVAYISGLITEAKTRFNVDEKRVFLMGHSNGGYMSYRMACDRAEQIAGIVSLAGAMPYDLTVCEPSEPVAVAHLHGTADTTILYNGLLPSFAGPGYLSAPDSVAFWTAFNGCDATLENSGSIDISAEIGSETDIEVSTNCASAAAELWTMNFAGHIPALNNEFPVKAMEFLLAHPKP